MAPMTPRLKVLSGSCIFFPLPHSPLALRLSHLVEPYPPPLSHRPPAVQVPEAHCTLGSLPAPKKCFPAQTCLLHVNRTLSFLHSFLLASLSFAHRHDPQTSGVAGILFPFKIPYLHFHLPVSPEPPLPRTWRLSHSQQQCRLFRHPSPWRTTIS